MRPERLTRALVEQAPKPAKDRFLWDGEVSGFGVKLTPAGARIYVLQYRRLGRSRRATIGRHGEPWTVETARARARNLLDLLEAGLDPQAEARAAENGLSVAELCGRYLAEGLAGKSRYAEADARRSLSNHVLPRIGALAADDVRPRDVDRIFASVAARETCEGAGLHARGGPQAANAAVSALRAAFGFGERRGLVSSNPARGVRPFRTRRIERYLDADDYARLGRVLAAAEALGLPDRTTVATLRFMALSGLRPGETLRLRWADLRAGGTLRVEDGFRGRTLHLGQAARELLAALPRTSDWVFPGPRGAPRSTLENVWRRLARAAGLEGVRLLDLRHSFAARAAGLGVEGPALGRLMGLRQAETLARYPKASHQALRDAADRIAGEVAGLLRAPAAQPAPAPDASDDAGLLAAAAAGGRCLAVGEAARRSGLTAGALCDLRSLGAGAPYRRVGHRIVYEETAFEIWLLGRSARRGAKTLSSG